MQLQHAPAAGIQSVQTDEEQPTTRACPTTLIAGWQPVQLLSAFYTHSPPCWANCSVNSGWGYTIAHKQLPARCIKLSLLSAAALLLLSCGLQHGMAGDMSPPACSWAGGEAHGGGPVLQGVQYHIIMYVGMYACTTVKLHCTCSPGCVLAQNMSC